MRIEIEQRTYFGTLYSVFGSFEVTGIETSVAKKWLC